MDYNEGREKKVGPIEVFGYTPETKTVEEVESAPIDVFDSLSIKYKDLLISIYGDEHGVLYGRTKSEVIKFCADVVLQAAGDTGLIDQIEIPIALQETLEFDYGWKKIDIFEFLRKWKRNIYLKQIGEENRTEENLEELEKALGVMNKQKTDEAIKKNFEVNNDVVSPIETDMDEKLNRTQEFSRDVSSPEKINSNDIEIVLEGETFVEKFKSHENINELEKLSEQKKVVKKNKK